MSPKILNSPFIYIFIIILGLIFRLVLACETFGTNDVFTWYEFCKVASTTGISEVYIKYPNANHPPLSLWLMSLIYRTADSFNLPFYLLFKVVVSIFDAITMGIIAFQGGFISLALYAFSPVALYTVGYHGNTDSVVVALGLVGATLVTYRKYPFIAGIFIGSCSSIKLIGVLLLPFLWRYEARCRPFAILGAIIPLSTLFLGMYLTPYQFLNQVLRYSPPFDYWGIPMLITMIAYEWRTMWSNFPKELISIYVPIAKVATVWVSLWIGKGSRTSLKLSERGDIFLVMGAFVALAPGFGMQYLIYPLPLMCCLLPKKAIMYNLFGGVAALALIKHFYQPVNGMPASFHNSTSPPLAIFFLFLTWVVMVDSLFSVLYKDKVAVDKTIR